MQSPSTPLPLDRFGQALLDSGMDEESVAFFLGRVSKEALARALNTAKSTLSSEWSSLSEIAENSEQMDAFKNLYEQKTGNPFEELVAKKLEELVNEFESLP